jgi:hypothetical protein
MWFRRSLRTLEAVLAGCIAKELAEDTVEVGQSAWVGRQIGPLHRRRRDRRWSCCWQTAQ